MNAQRQWSEDIATRAQSLRDNRIKVAPASDPDLPQTETTWIQNAIKQRISRADWWLPKEESNGTQATSAAD